MNRRNWVDLSRKLIDRFDLDFTVSAMQSALGQAALSYWGEGVLPTTTFPNPFPITMSGGSLGGSVGTGIGIDPNGQITEISASPDESTSFSIATADPTNARWDLLVISYQMIGDTLVPKPSDPISTVPLNLHDDFQLSVVKGTPSGSPVYPAKLTGQIILAGLRVPAGATLGTSVTVDLGIREVALQRVFEQPQFIHEIPTGVVNGVNTNFLLSHPPLNSSSVVVLIDGLVIPNTGFSLSGSTVVMTSAPSTGQLIDVWYIANNPQSQNPLAGFQEPGVNNGDNLTFNLSGRTASKASTIVFLDGELLPISQWSLVQGISKDQIVLLSAIGPGQDVYVFYLVNPTTVGVGPGGGGGGGTITGAQNIGSGQGLFFGVSAGVLQFRSIKAGTNISIVDDGMGDAVISAGAGSSGLQPNAAPGSPNVITAAGGIGILNVGREVQWVVSTGGAVPVTAIRQIQAGSSLGQEIVVKGTDNTNYPVLSDGTGLSLNGVMNLKANSSLYLVWDGAVWNEISRR